MPKFGYHSFTLGCCMCIKCGNETAKANNVAILPQTDGLDSAATSSAALLHDSYEREITVLALKFVDSLQGGRSKVWSHCSWMLVFGLLGANQSAVTVEILRISLWHLRS
jgi:hypothetical protein